MSVYRFSFWVDHVYDGDTLVGVLTADAGLGVDVSFGQPGKPTTYWRVRLLGVDAPELADAGGVEARDYARTLIPASTSISIDSARWDKYGRRVDALVELPDGRDMATVMVEAGHATPL